jgi:hypothetical protein
MKPWIALLVSVVGYAVVLCFSDSDRLALIVATLIYGAVLFCDFNTIFTNIFLSGKV